MIAVGDIIRHLESPEKFSVMIIKHLSLHMVNAESIRSNEKDLLAMLGVRLEDTNPHRSSALAE